MSVSILAAVAATNQVMTTQTTNEIARSEKVIIDHSQSGVVYNLIVSVCLSDDNFQKSWLRNFIFAHDLRVEFVYEGHRVKVMVMGTKKINKKFPFYQTYDHNMLACRRIEWSLPIALD